MALMLQARTLVLTTACPAMVTCS